MTDYAASKRPQKALRFHKKGYAGGRMSENDYNEKTDAELAALKAKEASPKTA